MNETNTERLRKYFEKLYPTRERPGAGLLFRKGELLRIEALRNLLPSLDGLSLLDVGCGDGFVISQLISSRLSLIRLLDIVEGNLRYAVDRLKGSADIVEFEKGDVFSKSSSKEKYDVVIAIGLLDYYQNHSEMLKYLLNYSKGTLIFDIPRPGTLHLQLRKAWLAMHGIRVFSLSRKDIDQLLKPFDMQQTVIELPLQFIIKLSTRGN